MEELLASYLDASVTAAEWDGDRYYRLKTIRALQADRRLDDERDGSCDAVRAGTALFPAHASDRGLRVYPTRHDDDRWSIIVVNVDEDAKNPFFELDGMSQDSSFELTSVSTSDLRTTSLGPPITTTADVTVHPPTDDVGTGFSLELPPYSINVVDITP